MPVPPSVVALLSEVASRVVTIALAIAVGVGLANVAVEFGAVDRIAALGKPLTDPANLPPEVGTAILTTGVSPTAGYGMLAEYRESGLLDDRATLVAVTINTFFGFVRHIFTFYAPVLVPILGLKVGALYVGARALVSLGITLLGVVGGMVLLSEANVDTTVDVDANATESDGGAEPTTAEKLSEAGRSTFSTLGGILPRLAGVYAVVVVLLEYSDRIGAALEAAAGGSLPDVAAVVEPVTAALGLPAAAVPSIAVFAVDTTSGAVFIAPFVENGTFTARGAVATMLVGGIVSFTVSTFKRSIPFQYGIWGAEFGTKVIVLNTTLKILFISLALVALLAL